METLNWKYDVYYSNNKDSICFESSFKTKKDLRETIKAARSQGNTRSIIPVESWVFDSVYKANKHKHIKIKRMIIYVRRPKSMME